MKEKIPVRPNVNDLISDTAVIVGLSGFLFFFFFFLVTLIFAVKPFKICHTFISLKFTEEEAQDENE